MEEILIERKARWVDFYAHPQPGARMAWFQFYPGLVVRPWPRPENTDARIAWAWAKYQIQLEQLRRRAGAQALFCMTDIQSPMDIATLIWEKTTFYTALLEEDGAVQELAGKTRSQ